MSSKPIFVVKRDTLKKGSGPNQFKRKIQSLPFYLTNQDQINKLQNTEHKLQKSQQKQPRLQYSKSYLISNRLYTKNTLSSRRRNLSNKQRDANKSLTPFLKMDNIAQKSPKILHSSSADRQMKKHTLQINKKSYLANPLTQRHHSARTQYLQKIQQIWKKQNDQTCLTDRKISIKYGFRTRQGKLANNPSKPNQDSYLIKQLTEQGSYLFAVADGHGLQGHLVSQLVVNRMEKYYMQEAVKSIQNPDVMFSEACNKIQQELFQTRQLNAANSGSTLISVLIDKKFHLTCANVGDSRAILARQINKKNWEIIHLSEDHKPNVDKERKRIIRKGGKVHTFVSQSGKCIGPQRVWLPNKNIQGLAMSRSMGDNVSKSIGVTHQPELTHIQLQSRDHFILIASDGVWDFIKNVEILQLVLPFYKQNKLQQCCEALLKLAYQRWTVEDDTVIDDITFILIFMNKD